MLTCPRSTALRWSQGCPLPSQPLLICTSSTSSEELQVQPPCPPNPSSPAPALCVPSSSKDSSSALPVPCSPAAYLPLSLGLLGLSISTPLPAPEPSALSSSTPGFLSFPGLAFVPGALGAHPLWVASPWQSLCPTWSPPGGAPDPSELTLFSPRPPLEPVWSLAPSSCWLSCTGAQLPAPGSRSCPQAPGSRQPSCGLWSFRLSPCAASSGHTGARPALPALLPAHLLPVALAPSPGPDSYCFHTCPGAQAGSGSRDRTLQPQVTSLSPALCPSLPWVLRPDPPVHPGLVLSPCPALCLQQPGRADPSGL